MTLALALLLLADQFDDAAEKVRFPADEVQREWAGKGDTHRKLVKMITDRRGWAKSFQTIQEKLALFPETVDIEVVIDEMEDAHPAWSRGKNGKGKVWFNMKRLVPFQKKLDDIEQEMKEGKLAAWIIPPQRPEALLTHELTHLVCGGPEEVWLSEGLATYVAGDESYFYNFNQRGAKVDSLDRAVTETDAYPRGMAFFRWMEKDYGADKVREFAGRVAGGGERASSAASDVLGKSWEKILAREKAWSAEYIAKFKTSR